MTQNSVVTKWETTFNTKILPTVEIEDTDKTITVLNSPCTDVQIDGKWMAVWRKRSEKKKAISGTHLVDKSLVNSRSES